MKEKGTRTENTLSGCSLFLGSIANFLANMSASAQNRRVQRQIKNIDWQQAEKNVRAKVKSGELPDDDMTGGFF